MTPWTGSGPTRRDHTTLYAVALQVGNEGMQLLAPSPLPRAMPDRDVGLHMADLRGMHMMDEYWSCICVHECEADT